MLDAVRAAHQVESIPLSNQTVVWGHSQGGHAALWTAQNVPVGPFVQPLFIGIGTADEVVSPSIQDAYVDSRCASGQPLEYRTYPGKTHMGVLQDDDSVLPMDLEHWTRDRLNGLPSSNTCAP
ncbi:MAG: hypothetical protein ACRD2Z_07795 [Thermoanaerobaculia bacterium]